MSASVLPGLQTRENNENHEAVNRVIFIVLEYL